MSARPTRRAARAVSTYAESPTRSTFPASATAETTHTSTHAQDESASAASEMTTARSDRNPAPSASTQSRGTSSSTRGGRGSRGGKRGGGRNQLTSPSKRSPSDHEHESDGADVGQEPSSAAAAAAGTSISLQDPTRVRSSASAASAAGGIPSGQTGQALVSHVQYCLKIVGDFIDHDDTEHPGTAYGPAVDSIARLVDDLLHKCKQPARFNRAPEGGATMVDQAVQVDSNTPASVLQALSVIVPPPTLAFASQLTSPPAPGSTLANMVLDAQQAARPAPLHHYHRSAGGVCTSCSCACHAASNPSSSTPVSGHSSAFARPQVPAAIPLPPNTNAALDASTLVNTKGNAPRGLTTQNGMGQKRDLQGVELVRAGNEAQQLHRVVQSTHSVDQQAGQHLEAFPASMTRRHVQFVDHHGDTTNPSDGPFSPATDPTATRSSAAHRLLGIRTANAESAVAAQLVAGPLESTSVPPPQLQDQHSPTLRHETTSPRASDSLFRHYGYADSPSFPGGAVARAVDQHSGYQNDEHIPGHSHGFDSYHQDGMAGHSNATGVDGSFESAAGYLPPASTGAAHQQQFDAGTIGVDQEPPRKRARTSLHQGFATVYEEGNGASMHQVAGGTFQQPQSVGTPPIPDRPDPEIVRSWASLSAAFNPTDPALMPLPWQNATSAASTTADSPSSYYDVQRAMNSAATSALASTSSSASPTVGMPTSGSDSRRDSVELTAGGISPGPDGDDGYDFSIFGPDFTEHGSPNPSQYNPDGGSMPLHMPGALDNGRIVRRRLAQFKMSALKASYAKSPYPDRMERARLCRDLGLEDKTITIWFNNQRKLHRERLRRAGINARGRSELPALPLQTQTLPRFHSYVGSPPSNTQSAPVNDYPLAFDDQSDFSSSVPSSAVDVSSESPLVDHSQSQRFPNGGQLGTSTHTYSLASPAMSTGSVHQSGVGSDAGPERGGDGAPFLSALVSPAQSDISLSSHRHVSDYAFPPPSAASPIPSSQGYISVVNAPPTTLAHDPFSGAHAFPSPTVGQQSQISYPGPVAPSSSDATSSYYQGLPPQHMQQQQQFNPMAQQLVVNGPGCSDSHPQQSPFSPSFVPPTFQEQGFIQGPASSDSAPMSAAASTPPTPAATPAPRSRRRSRNMSNMSNHGGGAPADNQQAMPSTSPPPAGSASTNIRGRWSATELEALRLAVLRHGRDWTAIHAAHGPDGTVDQSLGRLPSVRALRQKAYRLGLHTGSDAWLNEPFSEE